MTTLTRSTCCYCGVGCGVLIESEGEGEHKRIVGVRGDPEHPANFGRLCTKGLRLAESAQSLTGRLLYPELRTRRDTPRERVDWAQALDTVATRFADIIERHGPDSIAFYVSGQLLTEDYYVFNKLAKGLVGTNNIDTNSRLCMASAVTAYKLAFGADGPPGCYEDLELADCVLIAGSHMAWAHPVLMRRLEEARTPEKKWIVVDPRRTDTAAMADLHLAIRPGTDVALLNGMLHHLIWEGLIDRHYIDAHTVGFDALKALVREYPPRVAAELCGVAEADLIRAAEWFGRSRAALSLWCMGLNQSSHGTTKNLALINLHLATGQIARPGAGPFSLTGQPNAMGGREVGGMATALAAHRDIDNPAHRAEVARLWGVEQVSERPGLPAVALFDALKSGKVKAVYIACTNPVHSMPDIAQVRAALARAEFVVLQEAFAPTDTSAFADVLLPATTWGEKEGTVTNSERRISRVRAAIHAPGEARADWEIVTDIARRLEARLAPERSTLFPYAAAEAIFAEHRSLTIGRDLDIGGLSYAKLEQDGPQQWPLPTGASEGLSRRYADGRYATTDGHARFHSTPYQPVAEAINARFPFHLLTGRLRDQWHGMSRTGRVAQLLAHTPEPAVTLHPGDAGRRGFRAGDLLRVTSRRGSLVLPAVISEDIPSGSVFVPMHWSAQSLARGGSNELTIGAVDERSFQPELKHAAARIEAAELPWRVVMARRCHDPLALKLRLQPLLAACKYAALSFASVDVILLRAAAEEPMEAWCDQLFAAIELPAVPDLLEYRDRRRGVIKRAGWNGETLAGFLFAGDVQGADTVLGSLIDAQPWRGSRLGVFSPASMSGTQARDRVVCACKDVRESQIRRQLAIDTSFEALKSSLQCGTVCGSCLPELKRLSGALPPGI